VIFEARVGSTDTRMGIEPGVVLVPRTNPGPSATTPLAWLSVSRAASGIPSPLCATAPLRETVLCPDQFRIPVFTDDRFSMQPVSMDDRIREAVRQKLGDAISLPFPQFTPREPTLPTKGTVG